MYWVIDCVELFLNILHYMVVLRRLLVLQFDFVSKPTIIVVKDILNIIFICAFKIVER